MREGRERDRETLAHVGTKKHTGKRHGNAEDTGCVEARIQEHKYMYINMCVQTNQTVTTNQAGETDADAL